MNAAFLFASLLLSWNALAHDEAKACALHAWNEGELYQVESLPFLDRPTLIDFANFSRQERALIMAARPHVWEEVEMLEDYLGGFDDIAFETVTLLPQALPHLRTRQFKRLNYGVGGGNGGHVTFEVSDNGRMPSDYKLHAHDFDGDLLYCSEDFMQ